MSPSRRLVRVGALLLVAFLSVAACASIPKNTDPKVVKRVDEGTGETTAPAPPKDLDPLALVRSYVNSAAAPAKNYAAARTHLTRNLRDSWKAPRELLIVEGVNTVPLATPPGTPSTVRMVSLQVSKVGRLLPDRSFVPEEGVYETSIRVEQQRDGQWRIANPPPELVASRSSFTDNYQAVPVYFVDHARDGVVPDLRYVVRQPASARPARVVDLLLSGPSRGFRAAMGTALPPGARTETNVSESGNGALVVNFNDLGRVPRSERWLIAAQVVLSLQGVSNARVRLLEEGTPLLPDRGALRPADVAPYKRNNGVRADVAPLAVVDQRLVLLNPRAPSVPGPAGSGRYAVKTAARSSDGSKLATVVSDPAGGVRLRVGAYGEPLRASRVVGSFMSRPTWRDPGEVWTVVDGHEIVRLVDNGRGAWTVSRVDARAFSGGKPITGLRLSRDGTRVAGVVGGRIVVAGVADEAGRVTLQRPTVLTGSPTDAAVAGVEWLDNDSLVAVTEDSSVPVVEVTANGFLWTPYSSANLLQPLKSVTVGPGRKVVVADRNRLWQTSDQDELWQLLPVPISGNSIPFYPG